MCDVGQTLSLLLQLTFKSACDPPKFGLQKTFIFESLRVYASMGPLRHWVFLKKQILSGKLRRLRRDFVDLVSSSFPF